jgi:acetoacetyl-CoA synthetase
MATVSEGTLLWEPTEERKKSSGMYQYMQWLKERRGLEFQDYDALWQWSVDHLEDFWETVWEYTKVQSSAPYTGVLEKGKCPALNGFRVRVSTTRNTFSATCAQTNRPCSFSPNTTH